jgi:hypothetical protein
MAIGLDRPDLAPPDGLVDWLPSAGNTVSDISGNHVDGGVQGGTASYSAGPTGPALDLDGTRYVSAAAPSLGAMKAFTAETQVRVDGSGSYRRLIDYLPVGGDGSTGFMVDVNAANEVRFIGAGRVAQTDVALTEGQFAHLAVTLDAAGLLKVYLDGTMEWSQKGSLASIAPAGGLDLRFGADQNGGSRLVGKMGRTRIYDKAVTSDEVAADARAQVTFGAEACPSTVPFGTLIDWNPATGTDTQVVDTSDNRRDAYLHGVPSYTQGSAGPALVLNGGRYLTSGAKLNLGPLTALTLQARVKVDTTGSYRRVVDYIPPGGNGSTGFLVDLTPDNHVRFIGAGVAQVTGAVVPTGAFVDLALTLDAAGTLTVYQNGTSSWTGHVNPSAFGGCASRTLRVGADQNGASTLSGAVERVRLWGRALSAGEIATNAATPVTEQCRPNLGPGALVDWSPATGSSIAGTPTYSRPASILGTPSYFADTDGPAVVLTGTQSIQSVAKLNLAANLDEFTAAVRVRVDSSGSYRRLFDYVPAGRGATGLLIDLTSDNYVRYIAAGVQTVSSGAALPTGQFVDLAVTLSRTGMFTVYQNGVATWSKHLAVAVSNNCISLPLRFGRDQNGGSLLKAPVGRVRLWDRTLSAAEIAAL